MGRGDALLGTRLGFAALGALFVVFAGLTAAGVPNGLTPGTAPWWAVVALLAFDGCLFGGVAAGLGTHRAPLWRTLGLLLVASNLALLVFDQFGVADLVVALLLIAAGAALYLNRSRVST